MPHVKTRGDARPRHAFRRCAIGVVPLAGALAGGVACGAGAAGATGATGATGPAENGLRTAWVTPGRSWGMPAVDGEAAYYVTVDHRLVALEKQNGAVRWDVALSTGAPQPPGLAVVVAGPVVAAVDNGAVYAANRVGGTGRRWAFLPPGGLAAEDWISSDSTTVYVGTTSGRLFALDAATGAVRWDARVSDDPAAMIMGPRVAGGTVYVGVKRVGTPSTGGVAAVDARTGALRWMRRFEPESSARGAGCAGQIAVTAGGAIVGVAESGRLYALEPATGAVRWTVAPLTGVPAALGGDPAIDQRPLAAADDLLIVGSTTGYVLGLDAATGMERWRTRADYGSAVFPLVVAGGTVYATHFGGQLVTFDARTGAVRSVTGANRDGGAFVNAPVYDQGRLYVGGRQGKYALVAAP